MGHVKSITTRFALLWGVLAVSLVIIAIAFGVHCYNVNEFNAATHTITAEDAGDTGVSVSVHPRGQTTDKWDKQDEELGVKLKGVIYEATVTNGSKTSISDWTLRFDFNDGNYFLNNAWCGTVEIHQPTADGEDVQTLDLRNFERDSITLAHHISGSDIMIDITPGSSIIYYPNADENEQPVDSAGNVSVGMIMYSYTDDLNMSGYTFEYHLHKGYFDSRGSWFVLAFMLWLFAFIFVCVLRIMSRIYEKRIHMRDTQIREALEVFTKFIDAKDPYTEGHSERVAENSCLIAEKLGFKEDRCQEIYYSALLHDIGKCYVPDEILKKPSRLTDEEFAIIKQHTILGAKMVENFTSIPDVRDAMLYHHERYDGKGYPTGRAGEDIPLIGRIICVVDSYDAMNSDRVYRKKLSREVIVEELEKNKGTQFDPQIADIFLEILAETAEDGRKA